MAKPTLVLVHSAWLGGWSWGHTTPFLEKTGYKVIAPDLPAHGQDKTKLSDVTLDSYVERIVSLIDQEEGQCILVGHSFSGVVISQVAEKRSNKISSLVYLCAALLPNGASFLQAVEGVKGSIVLDNLVMSEDQASVGIKEEVIHEAVAHDVPEEAFLAAKPMIVNEPTKPLGTPLSITEEKWGSIPRYYIETLNDNAIPPEVQKSMYTALPVKKVFTMNTSHAPNFAQPEELAQNILSIANN